MLCIVCVADKSCKTEHVVQSYQGGRGRFPYMGDAVMSGTKALSHFRPRQGTMPSVYNKKQNSQSNLDSFGLKYGMVFAL